jgi:hypothetical protein
MADESERLPERAEALLAGFGAPECDFEAQASAIEARVRDVQLRSTEPRWLEAPFPDQYEAADDDAIAPGKGSLHDAPPFATSAIEAAASDSVGVGTSATATPRGASARPLASSPSASSSAPPPPSAGSGQSLSALARSVAQKGPRPQASDIAKESLSVAAAARAHTDKIVERVRSSRSEVASASSAQRPSAPGASAPLSAPPSANSLGASAPSAPASDFPSTPPSSRPRASRGPWLAVAAIGFAAAAAILFIGRSREPASLPDVARGPSEQPARGVAENAAPIVKQKPVAAAPVPAAPSAEATLQEPPKEEERASAAGAEPPPASRLAAGSAARPAAAKVPAANAVAQRFAGAVMPGAASAASAMRPAPEAVVLDEAPRGTDAQAAPTTTQSALRPASGAPSGGLPDKPSTGAVQAALGSVMGPARACLAGTTAAAPAQVTFGSDGAVKTASVTGPTAGSPVASCIETALRRARVAPFAAASFSLGVWVRP